MNRYHRQTIIPEVGLIGQNSLLNAKVLIVGIGGLGCPVALYLASAGVGHIGLVDDDNVELTNLQRQVLFSEKNHNQLKVYAAKERLLEINSEIVVDTFPERLTLNNALQIITAYDLVIDGTDNFTTKFIINDTCLKLRKPWIYAAIEGLDGQLALFKSEGSACYRCLVNEIPKSKIQSCSEIGVLGTTTGVFGALQSQLAVQYLISMGHPKHELQPTEKITYISFCGEWNFKSVVLEKNRNCKSCSIYAEQLVLSNSNDDCNLQTNGRGFKAINCKSLYDLLGDKNSVPLVIDVRDYSEWRTARIKNSINIPIAEFSNGRRHEMLDLATNIIFYCSLGLKAQTAAYIYSSEKTDSNIFFLRDNFQNISKDLLEDL